MSEVLWVAIERTYKLNSIVVSPSCGDDNHAVGDVIMAQ
jgi:hypothetical protein